MESTSLGLKKYRPLGRVIDSFSQEHGFQFGFVPLDDIIVTYDASGRFPSTSFKGSDDLSYPTLFHSSTLRNFLSSNTPFVRYSPSDSQSFSLSEILTLADISYGVCSGFYGPVKFDYLTVFEKENDGDSSIVEEVATFISPITNYFSIVYNNLNSRGNIFSLGLNISSSLREDFFESSLSDSSVLYFNSSNLSDGSLFKSLELIFDSEL